MTTLDTERVLGQIERGEMWCGPDAARAIAARHEEQYGNAWSRRTREAAATAARSQGAWAEAVASLPTNTTPNGAS